MRALDEDPPDLVMLDVTLPGIDGWEMLRRVRERHGNETLPVIMFSGKIDEGDDAEERGATRSSASRSRPARARRAGKAPFRVRVTQYG